MSYAVLGAAAIGAVSSYASSQNYWQDEEGGEGGKGGGGGASGQFGPKVITMPQYSFTEPRMRLTSDFISDNIQRMGEGKYPAYYEKAMPQLREGMSRPLRERYFGGQGMQGQSVMGQVRATGAALGMGPRATLARENKALFDYSNKETAIDEYLTKQGVNIMQQDAYRFPYLSSGMKQGPDAQILGGQAYRTPQKEDGMGGAMASLAGGIPWESMFQSDDPTAGGGAGSYNSPDYYYSGYDTPGSTNWFGGDSYAGAQSMSSPISGTLSY